MSLSGFSSRSTSQTIRQFPQRDEVTMSQMQPGFSNSEPNEDANKVVVEAPAKAESEAKVVDDGKVEDKAVAKKRTTRKKS